MSSEILKVSSPRFPSPKAHHTSYTITRAQTPGLTSYCSPKRVRHSRTFRTRSETEPSGYNFPSEIKHPIALCTFINHSLFICPCYARSVNVHVCILHNPLCICYCNPLATQKLLLMMNRNQMCPETGTERALSRLYD